MNLPDLTEFYMLLGEKQVQLYQAEKLIGQLGEEIKKLQQMILAQRLTYENQQTLEENTNKSDGGGRSDSRVVSFQQPFTPTRGTNKGISGPEASST